MISLQIKSLRTLYLLLVAALFFLNSCQKNQEPNLTTNNLPGKKNDSHKKTGHFSEVRLVANTPALGASRVDPTLINAWGIAFAPQGIAWVNSQAGHLSEVWNAQGIPLSISPVQIPNPVSPTGGNPTGIVFNGTTDFQISGGPARFIFVGVDGVLSAWNPTLGHQAMRVGTVPGAALTGLATGVNGTANMLYAADFRGNRILTWGGSFNPVLLPFQDPNLPSGYAPYNIQNLGGMLYVAYAKVGANGRSEAGDGKGLVDIYRTDGSFVGRFATGGTLNAPWGLAMAPSSFIKDDEGDDAQNSQQPVILVGNFGNGRINAFSSSGKFLGQLRGEKGQALAIEGLWALKFPPSTSTIDPNRLYFSAGPAQETEDLFGYIIPKVDDDDKE